MTSQVRLDLHVALPRTATPPDPWWRHPSAADAKELGVLMWAAYAGTPDQEEGDDEPGAIRELDRLFAGAYGPLIEAASFVIDGTGATLVTHWQGAPLLAYVFIHPDHRGRGIGKRLVEASMHALGRLGHDRLTLAVSTANTPARALYRRLGFR